LKNYDKFDFVDGHWSIKNKSNPISYIMKKNIRKKTVDVILEKIKFFAFDHPWMLQSAKLFLSNRLVANSSIYRFLVMRKAARIAEENKVCKQTVYIETALTCNSSCVFCAHHYQKMAGIMSMDLFKKIIDECHEFGVKHVNLGIYGEILVDKDLFEKIAYLRKYDMTYGIVTNASLLTSEKVNRFFELGGLNYVNFSMNGFSKEVYEKTMVGLKRDATYENVLHFLREKEKRGADELIVTISAVLTKINKKDFKNFFRFWRRQKGIYMILPVELVDRMGKEYDGKIGKLGPMTKKNNWLSPCRALWGSLMIYHDGKVGPCCVESDKRKLIVGDATRQTIEEISTGEALNNLRQRHLAGRRKDLPICGRCYLNSVWFGQ
jgi:MoaA/NifB/PqqE/SkfB family radical SAM enzyme